MFSKILLCSDGSEGALTATKMGVQIAQRFHSAVLLVHSYEPTFTEYAAFGGEGWEAAANQDVLDTEDEAARRNLIVYTGKILLDAGLECRTLLECGHPVESITRVAKEQGVDLIVLGGRGVSDVAAFLLGSVSEEVLHHSHCPVLIVRGDSAVPLQHVLLASDGSEDACQAAGVAIHFAQKFAATLRVLNVLDGASLPSGLAPVPCAESATPYARAERLLAKITKDVGAGARGTGVACTFHQETGNPAGIIVALAARQQADLIILGCRGRSTLNSLLLGSVSNSVAHSAHCSVLVMR